MHTRQAKQGHEAREVSETNMRGRQLKQAHEQARRKEKKTCIVEGTQKKKTLNSLNT